MQVSPIALGVDFHTGDDLQAGANCRLLGLRHPAQRIVVRERDHGQSTLQCHINKFRRRVHAVGGCAMEMQVYSVVVLTHRFSTPSRTAVLS